MKKGIVVLLIAVLVAGFAFAGSLSGYANISFGVDFDEAGWGFSNKGYGNYTFKFDYDSTVVSVGADHETDIWAELEASVSAYLTLTGKDMESGDSGASTDVVSFEISAANIHIGEDLTIGILESGDTTNFAKHYYVKSKVYAEDTVNGASNKKGGALETSSIAPGFTVTFKDWFGGFGAEGNWEDEEYTVYAHILTPEFKFAEDALTVKAGGYGVYTDADSYAGGGAKVAYAADKFSVDAEADVVVKKDDVDFAYEAAANAKLNFVEDLPITLNVYATPGLISSKASSYNTDDYKNLPKLDAKASTSYTLSASDDISIDLSAYVDARDILIDAREFTLSATEETAVDAFTLSFTETYAIMAKTLDLSESVEYAADKFTAYAELGQELDFSADDVFTTLSLEAGVSSTAIVEKATLSLVYANDDFIGSDASKGNLVASCKIAY